MDLSIVESHLLIKGNSYYNSDLFKLEKINIKSHQHEESTGLFCFRDELLPELTVSRGTIQRFTAEIIAHVLYGMLYHAVG